MNMYRKSGQNSSDTPNSADNYNDIVSDNSNDDTDSIISGTSLVTGNTDNQNFSEKGFLRVKVTTGRGSIPVENAKVTVTYYKNGEFCLAGTFFTDSSGQTEILELPAPSKATSEKPDILYPSALYDIEITAEGYYDVVSRDVPVFEGITSLQNVDVIPVSTGYKSSDGETIYNNSSLA